MSANRSTTFAAAAFAALSICCANSSAQAADSGFYIGIGGGQGDFKDQVASPSSSGTIDFEASSNAYKAFAGYRMDAIPLLDFAVEAGYHYFGKATQSSIPQSSTYSMDAGSVAGFVILPLGPVDLFGKGGAVYSTLNKNVGGTTSSRTGTYPLYGAGIGIRIGKIGIRAEYEYFDVNVSRMQAYTASVLIQF